MSVLTPNMNLIQPTIGVDSGLVWENGINANSSTVDQHNHSPGYGVPIPPSGININAALPFNNFPATSLQASVYQAQSSLSTALAVYVIGTDLYYNDGVNPPNRITSAGAVNATNSGISSPPATASFVGGVLVVNANTNTPANIQVGSVLLGNNVPASNFLTLAPPAAMAANITETLPTIPAATAFMTMDSSGNMATNVPIANGITRSMQAAVGQQISASVTASRSSIGFASTALTVTITTTGRPVMIMLQPDGSGLGTTGNISLTAAGNGDIAIVRDGLSFSPIAQSTLAAAAAIEVPPGVINFLDVPSAASHSYTIYLSLNSGTAIVINNCKLVAYEL